MVIIDLIDLNTAYLLHVLSSINSHSVIHLLHMNFSFATALIFTDMSRKILLKIISASGNLYTSSGVSLSVTKNSINFCEKKQEYKGIFN